jgi:hypothetical protein
MFDVVDIMEADVVKFDGNKSCHVLLAKTGQSSARDAVVDNRAVTFGKSCHIVLAKSGNSRKSASDDAFMDIMVVNKVFESSILLLVVVSLFQEASFGTEIGSSIVSIPADAGLSSAPATSTISRRLDISSNLFKNDDLCDLLLLAEDGMGIPAAIAAKGYLQEAPIFVSLS